MTVILHLSDPHLDLSAARRARLAAVLRAGLGRAPDAVVLSGDLADHGAAAEYRELREALDTSPPWLAVPGNHDDPATMAEQLGHAATPVLELAGGTRVIGIDATVPGADHGHLRDETADAVAAAARGARRVVLVLHHPPVRIGHAFADAMMLDDPDALAGLVARLPLVAAILCGHVHTPVAAALAGIPVRAAPGIATALGLDPARRPLTSDRLPPGFALHRLEPSGVVTTTVHYADASST